MISHIVIVGAGFSGMITAALLRQRHPQLPISIIEQSAGPGGLYSSVHYNEGGYFDYGMHIIYDTGIEEVDTLLHSLLLQKEWNILEGNYKDIAGIFWNQKLQQHSPYIDLRYLAESGHNEYVQALTQAIEKPQLTHDNNDAASYLTARFGAPAASHLCKVVEKLMDAPAEQVSAYITRQPTMDRVLLFDAPEMPPILGSEPLRARVGYPDQLTLPALRTGNQCGWYPRQLGISHVIGALKERLEHDNVRFIFNTAIEQLNYSNGYIQSIHTRTPQGPVKIDNVETLYWTAGWPGISKLLSAPGLATKKHAPAAYIHLRFLQPLQMGPLYHFYCFDSGYRTFRVTNYSAYCPDAVNDLGYPVCVEYWPGDHESPDSYIASAVSELRAFGVIDKDTQPTFSAMQLTPNYHKLFMLDTVRSITALREHIEQMQIKNLVHIGVMASGGELLSYEILRDAHGKLR